MSHDSDPWYYPADLPRGQLVVEVHWNGRHFVAARLRTPAGLRWALPPKPNEQVEFLPPQKEKERWGADPTLWRPRDASVWTWPNGSVPAAARVVEPRIWNARTSFQAVEDAEAADLVADMQADRDSANANAESSKGQKKKPARGMKRQLWWLDQSLIKYESPPTRFDDVEGRLMRAMVADGDERDSILKQLNMQRAPGLLGAGVSLDMLSRLAEAECRNPRENVMKFTPNNVDLENYLTTIDWLVGVVVGRPRSVLWCASRMQGYSWSEVAEIVAFAERKSKTEARQELLTAKRAAAIYRAAVGEAFDVARGIPTPTSLARLRKLEAVQAGNLRARRS